MNILLKSHFFKKTSFLSLKSELESNASFFFLMGPPTDLSLEVFLCFEKALFAEKEH